MPAAAVALVKCAQERTATFWHAAVSQMWHEQWQRAPLPSTPLPVFPHSLAVDVAWCAAACIIHHRPVVGCVEEDLSWVGMHQQLEGGGLGSAWVNQQQEKRSSSSWGAQLCPG